MPIIAIDDAGDPRLTDYRNVPDRDLLDRGGLFVAEGRLVVRRLLGNSRLTTRSAMVTGAGLAAVDDVLGTRPALPVYVVPQAVMNAVTGFHIHRGCLALGERPPAQDWRLLAGGRRLVVLEGVGNADNIGAIFRSAAAFQADAVLLGPACADPLYRKSIRTSMGATLAVPFAAAVPWPGALGDLRARGLAIVALTPSGTAGDLDTVAAAVRDRPVAIVLGHEGDGLSAEALDASTHRARIPIAPEVDSLNVATAASIALYALSRRT